MTPDAGFAGNGLSPRGRGNPDDQQHLGSIPAWAGEPFWSHVGWSTARVYPRVGGGTSPLSTKGSVIPGLSPRGRGNLAGPRASISKQGLSPRGRGNLLPSDIWFATRDRVYPRVGGGTRFEPPICLVSHGSIPAWAGEPIRAVSSVDRGSIPAWAGEPKNCRRRLPLGWVYPRVGGGTGCRVPAAQV